MEEEEVSNDKGKKCAALPVYASWSEGARKLDEEMQKNLETPDERRLASIVAALGHYETTESDWHERPELFVKGPKCLEKLKELQRCLTRDNPDRRRIFLQLGSWNLVGRYIVPIIMRYPEDPHLFLTALKVAILLTLPVDRTSDNTCDQVDYLCQIKDEFRECNVIGAVVAHLEEPLEHMENGAVTEDDWRLLQLVLTLFQNLLAIPESMNWVGPYPVARYSHLRDGILECMFRESATDILLVIARNLPAYHNRRDNLLILQVLHHIFWGQKPEVLVKAATNEGGEQKTAQQEAARRQALVDDERERKRKLQMKNLPRHSHFSGTFVRIEQDGSKTMLVRNPFQRREDIIEKRSELRLNGHKEKPVARDVDVPLPSRDDISALLKSYADQFLATGGYNTLMQSVKDDIRRDRTGLEVSDVVTFFQVAQFFTSYQHYHFSLKQAIRGDAANGCAVDESTIQGRFCSHISSTMDEEMFKMVISKWLEYLEAAKTPNDWIQVVAAGALLKEMIYILDMVLKNRSQDAQRDTRMARTLLYKLFYDQTENGILNTTYKAIKAFSIHRHPRSHLSNMVAITHVVIRLIEGLTREEGALRVSKKVRKKKSKKTHTENYGEDAAARTEDSQILTKDVENGDADTVAANLGCSTHPDEQIHINEGEKQPEEVHDEGEEHEEDDDLMKEFTLDVRRCVEKFADSAIIAKYCWLLMFYNSNSPAMNYYIVCMLQRICKDCMLEPMLYQASILEKFQAILSDKKIAELDEYKSLLSFVTKVVRNFFKKLKSNPLLYVDVLFVKNRKLCHEITADYMIHKLKGETRGLGVKRRCISDALGEDEGGTFNQMPSDNPSTQAGEQGVALRKAAPKTRRSRCPFSAEDDARIKGLYERFKEKRGCSRLIAEAMNPEGTFSAAQVTRRLKQLGLQRVPAKSESTSKQVIEPSDSENNGGQLENNDETELDTSSNEDDETCLDVDNEMNKSDYATRERVPTRKRRLIKPRDHVNSDLNREYVEQFHIPRFQQESEDEDIRERLPSGNKKLVKQHDNADTASNIEEPNIFHQQESGDDHHEGLNESEHAIPDTASLQQEFENEDGHHQSLSKSDDAPPDHAPTRRKRLVKHTTDVDVYIDSSNVEDLIDDDLNKEVIVSSQAKRRALTITED